LSDRTEGGWGVECERILEKIIMKREKEEEILTNYSDNKMKIKCG
jgi:hypothetical protein